MELRIKKRTQIGWLMWVIIMLPFTFGLMNGLLNIPYSIRYIIDFAWGVLVLFRIKTQNRAKKRITGNLLVWICLFFLYVFLVYLVQFQQPQYFLWGLRNNFRFYAAFFAFVLFLTASDAEDYFKAFDGLFWLNAIVSVVQFYILGFYGDYLGGIFGVETGANAYTNIFFLIIITKSIVFYIEKKETLKLCLAKVATAMFVAALAELKFFFVETILVIVLAVLFANFSRRTVLIVAGGLLAVIVGMMFLVVIFPGSAFMFVPEEFFEAAITNRGYTSSGDLNRLNAISQINARWLKTWPERLFGMGMGNCETSSFGFLNTPFFRANEHMHYTWLSYAMMYLECGWLGLIFYFGFFVLVFFRILKVERRCEGVAKSYCRVSRIMAVLCAVISIYNSSLRTEVGYMAYFVLAIPFVYAREVVSKERRLKVQNHELE